MNIIDLRKSLEQSPTSKRMSDRRQVPYAFGSPEWMEYMRRNNLECPPQDRRKGPRRSSDSGQQASAESVNENKPYHRILLTPAERTLLEDLYLIDLD